MTTPFPTKLSDLAPSDPLTTPTLYTTLKHLRRTTLSLHNRLRSILTDATYITNTIHPLFRPLPLIANERCGSWYIPPQLKLGGSAYFKSTDGHYGFWTFSLRRLNLQVLEILGEHGGAVLVDSTRRGKRMPDALRRTVPVWVLVWNWVLFREELNGASGRREEMGWAFRLQHPGLEAGEVRLIEKGLEGWVEGVRGLGLDLDGLRKKVRKPIRLMWVVHGEEIDSEVARSEEWNLLVLCSASRRVLGAEMSEDGYVQGAADDAEGWSGGLTPSVFWKHKDELMKTGEEDLQELISRLVQEGKAVTSKAQAIQVRPTENLFVAVSSQTDIEDGLRTFDIVINCNGIACDENPHVVNLGCRSGKLGSRDLRDKLPRAVEAVLEGLRKNSASRILIICETGKDLSIGVVVTLLCLLYDDEGRLELSRAAAADKQLVKKRLAWITSIKPDANPSRSTLQAVNSFLMS